MRGPGDHLAGHHREVIRNVRHATQVEVDLHQVHVRHDLRALHNLDRLFAGHAPFGGVALLLHRSRSMHGDALAFGEGVEIEREADPDVHVLTEPFSDRVDPVELVHRIDVDAQPVGNRHLQLFVFFVRAVQDERLRVRSGQESEIHLGVPKAVPPRPFLIHDVADGQPVVGLVREQDLRIGIVLAEGVAERSIGVPKLILRHDEQRAAESLHQLRDVTPVDPQVAVRADADELAETGLIFARIQLRRAPCLWKSACTHR